MTSFVRRFMKDSIAGSYRVTVSKFKLVFACLEYFSACMILRT